MVDGRLDFGVWWIDWWEQSGWCRWVRYFVDFPFHKEEGRVRTVFGGPSIGTTLRVMVRCSGSVESV